MMFVSHEYEFSFHYRSLSVNGLIFYVHNDHREYIAIELHKSRIRFVFDIGDGPKVSRIINVITLYNTGAIRTQPTNTCMAMAYSIGDTTLKGGVRDESG
jgi:hypothetical protein